MASFWPTEQALTDDPFVARFMNEAHKIVFSNTLMHADWQNTQLVHGEAADAVARLKNQPGKDLMILGSGKLTVSLAENGLIDEFRFMLNPVLLGSGAALFAGLTARQKLRLLETHVFKNGNVLLAYAPQK
jgi:dihydrofolate reductase